MSDLSPRLGLVFNPFEPAAAGPPIGIVCAPPPAIENRIRQLVAGLEPTRGTKVIPIVGQYGTGKTCLLRWLHDVVLPERRIRPFYFDNPGVHFYDLANTLLRDVGRKDFAKFIWEFAGPHVTAPYQRSLFHKSFEEYLRAENGPRQSRVRGVAEVLQSAILSAGITVDEQIAHCLARIVADAVRKPYFEYRDFLPQQTDSLVAEAQEAPYFRAILATLARGSGASGIAFLIDEFEEIGLQKRLTKRAAHDYLSTLKRLINLTQDHDNPFWVFLSMTPDAYATTVGLEPGLAERFAEHSHVVHLDPLGKADTATLVRRRVEAARPPGFVHPDGHSLFPFPEDLPFRPTTCSNARRLVKACFAAISSADGDTELPFSRNHLRAIEANLFSVELEGTGGDG